MINANSVLSWLLTYAMHSSVLLGAVWLLDRRVLRAAVDREHAWKAAAFGAIVTTAVQLSILSIRPDAAPVSMRWEMPAAAVAEQPAVEPAPIEFNATPTPQQTGPINVGRERTINVSWQDALLLMWLIGVALGLLRFVLRRRMVANYVGARTPATDTDLLATLNALQRRSGCQTTPRLTVCHRNISPLVFSSNEICLPAPLLAQLTERQRKSVLAHELAHIARRDPAWLAAFTWLETLLFFQPLNWLARRRAQECAEYACDARAARMIDSPIPMAETLVEVARWMQLPQRPLPYPAMAEDASMLATRVQRLLHADYKALPRYVRVAVVMLLLSGALIAPAVTNAIPVIDVQDDRPRFKGFEWNGDFANGGAEVAKAYNAWRQKGADELAKYIARNGNATIRFEYASRAGICGTGVEKDGSRMFALQPTSKWLPTGKPNEIVLYTSHGAELRRNIVGVDGTWTTPCQANAATRVDVHTRNGKVADVQITVGNPAPKASNLRDLENIPAPIAGTYLLTLAKTDTEYAERALIAAVMGEGGAGEDELYALIGDFGVARNVKTAAREWAAPLAAKPKQSRTAPSRLRGMTDLNHPLAKRVALLRDATVDEVIAIYDFVPDRAMRVELIEWMAKRANPKVVSKLREIVKEAGIVEEHDAAKRALIEMSAYRDNGGDVVSETVLKVVADPRQPDETRMKALQWAWDQGATFRLLRQTVQKVERKELREQMDEYLSRVSR